MRSKSSVRSRAYTISTLDPRSDLIVSETSGRTRVRVSISTNTQNGLSVSCELDKEQWDALMELKYDVELEEPAPETPSRPTRAQVDQFVARVASGEIPGVPPGERAIEPPLDESQTVSLDGCPNNLQPEGPVCPRCGKKRAPSGLDGGSWVHFAGDDSERDNPQPNAPNAEDDIPF